MLSTWTRHAKRGRSFDRFFLFSIFLKFDQKNKKALICRTFSSWENKAWAKANNTNLHDGMLRKYTPEQIDFAWRLHTGAILKSARN